MNISIVGLGHMGSAVAERLLKSGVDITVYNRTASKADPLATLGASAATHLSDAVSHADIVISCLLNDQALTDTTTGDQGILTYLRPDSIHISISTVLPNTAEDMAKAHQAHGSHYVSACVLGVPPVALAGELTCFCATKENIFAKIEPVLSHLCKAITLMDNNPRSPLVMKICMNYALINSLELISELYCFAEKSGLDLDYVQGALKQIYGHPSFQLYADKIRDRNFDQVNFSMVGGLKDANLFLQAFNEAGVDPKLVDVAQQRLQAGVDEGLANKDWSALYEIIRQQSKLS